MLYLITSPPVMQPGNYVCDEIATERAAEMIKGADSTQTLRSFVQFGSTRFAIQKLCNIKVELVRKISLPNPQDGDVYLEVRLKADTEKGRVDAPDLEFFQIRFASKE